MSYVPPHKRVSSNCKFEPTPALPPSSSSKAGPSVPQISRSSDFVGRFAILAFGKNCDPPLQFVRFEGRSFGHLDTRILYSLRVADSSSTETKAGCDSDGNADLFARMNLDDSPALSILKTLECDTSDVLDKLQGIAKSNPHATPLISVRLGRLLFNTSQRNFVWEGPHNKESVHKITSQGGPVGKTFDNTVSEDEFYFLQGMALKHASEHRQKEHFLIQIEDKTRSNARFWLECMPAKNRVGHLQLKRICLQTERHMVIDVACIEKPKDFRLAFLTRQCIHNFSETELSDLNIIVSKATVDKSTKGGLNWPLGGTRSMSGRFEVVSTWHDVQMNIVGSEIKWHFKVCNRMDLKNSWGRVSYEVSLKPCAFKDFWKQRKSCNIDDVKQSIDKLLLRLLTVWL